MGYSYFIQSPTYFADTKVIIIIIVVISPSYYLNSIVARIDYSSMFKANAFTFLEIKLNSID